MITPTEPTIQSELESYIGELESTLKPNTIRSYEGALKTFAEALDDHGVDASATPLSLVSEEWVLWLMERVQHLSRSTQRVYATAVVGWYEHLTVDERLTLDMTAVRQYSLAWQEKPPPLTRYQPTEEQINRVVEYCATVVPRPDDSQRERLRLLRDRAIILGLADAEIDLDRLVGLKRSDVSWAGPICSIHSTSEDTQGVALSRRASDALRDYLNARASHDEIQGVPITRLYLFARHDKGSGSKLLPLSTTSIRSIVRARSSQILGKAIGSAITPRDLRRYSVISKLLAVLPSFHPQVVTSCRQMFELGQYDDAIFNALRLVEEQVRARANLGPSDYGTDLITKAMHPSNPILSISEIPSEQESAYFLFRGSIGFLKNPRSHRSVGTSDPVRALESMALASQLLRILDAVP